MNKNIRILIVDDFSTMRRIVKNLLADLGFTNTAEAEDGSGALAMLRAESFDFVVTDWNMPVMDGYTFIQRVRANPRWRNITLMMVTTESEQGQIVRALAAGAHEYVIKPFTPDAIVDKLDMLGLVQRGVA